MAGNNFNVTELTDLQSRASTTFASIIENINSIKSECTQMSGIVASEDSALGSRWDSVSTNMEKPIQSIDDTFLIVKTLLDKYVADTIENEKEAQKELESIDEGIGSLGNLASTLFEGLRALQGIGFGGSAIAIPGLGGGGNNISDPGRPVVKYGPPTPVSPVDPDRPVVKYGPPTPVDPIEPVNPDMPVVKYGPPTPVSPVNPDMPVVKYGPPTPVNPISPDMPVVKYGPPTEIGPISPDMPVVKYGPPTEIGPISPDMPVVKYGPPTEIGPIKPVNPGVVEVKYGPPPVKTGSSTGIGGSASN